VEQIYEKTILYPFSFDPQGNVATTIDQNKIWQDRVLAVLGTGFGERVQRLDFGTDVYQTDFQTSDSAISEVKRMAAIAFHNYLPLLTLESVDGFFDPSNGTVTMEVSYRLPNRTIVTIELNTVVIDGNTPPKEI
jgi:hypothetical protein